jgi:hypothetical protein
MSFIIYALPRSRSAWMAHFLNYPMARPLQPVGHNIAALCGSIEAFIDAYTKEGMFGTVELEGAVGWQLIRRELPDLRTVVVRRPIQEVYKSIASIPHLQPHLTDLAELNEVLNVICAQPNVYTINSADLDAPVVCRWLFEYCLELEFDFDWWSSLTMLDIQLKPDDIVEMLPEMNRMTQAYKQDVLNRMKEISNCLN